MDADDDQVWRCKACGTRQPDPHPPCERCWNTTFVAGDGADDAVGDDEGLLAVDPLRVAQVRSTASRTGAATGSFAALLWGVAAALPTGTASTLAFAVFGCVAAVAAVFLVVAAAAALVDAAGVA